tara:strand:+ start:4554 stop:5534 length:981 start_codon:yes stop_codon:yes gene_type:complete
MYIVTGGAGFIGSNVVKFLTENLNSRVCVVDKINNLNKKNLAKRKNIIVIHPEKLNNFLKNNEKIIDVVIHFGAITSTTETNAKEIIKNNIELSLLLWHWCSKHKKRIIYASSAATYGNGENGFNDTNSLNKLCELKPLNLYGWSKHIIDKYFIESSVNKIRPKQWIGLKFFNVYGPNEYHKGEMQSIIFKIFKKIESNKKVNLFKSHNKKYKDGEQLRDFIYVKDILKIIQWFIVNKKINGIFNIGTGKARTFNDLAQNVFKYTNKKKIIHFIDTPIKIRKKYQYFTEANVCNLRRIGYSKEFYSLEEGIEDYIKTYLLKKDRFN